MHVWYVSKQRGAAHVAKLTLMLAAVQSANRSATRASDTVLLVLMISATVIFTVYAGMFSCLSNPHMQWNMICQALTRQLAA